MEARKAPVKLVRALVFLPLAVACGAAAPPADPASDPAGPPPGPETPGVTLPPGPVDPPKPDCTRAAQVKTAPLALYDAFAADTASPARVDKLVADVRAAGGTPLEDPAGDRVVFLARGGSPLKVVGSFVGWNAGSALAMVSVPGTDLWVLDTKLPRGTSHEYKLLAGSSFLEDPLAKNVTWDGLDRGFGVRGEFNAVAHAQDLPKDKGRLVALGKTHATQLANDRDVWVYTPPRYDDASCSKLPHVMIHDGNESLTRGGFAREADTLYAARPELSAILVFVGLPSQDVRMSEYSFNGTSKGLQYIDFLANDLLPALAKTHRLCGKAAARGISGASLGGLISSFAAFEKADVWGWVGAQSASFFWDNNALIARVQNEAVRPVRFYLDSGEPNDNFVVTNEFAAALQQRGYDYVRITEDDGEHDWPYWRGRFAGMLTHFRDKQSVCD
jgi:enterochelin esterase family protein